MEKMIAIKRLFRHELPMRIHYRRVLITALLFVGGFATWNASAVGPEVRDSAGIFSANAVKQADETVRRIQKEFRKDLLVETFAGIPDNRTEDYKRNREDFFSNFVRERAQAARIDGIYVLVLKEPPPHRYRIQVAVGQVTRQRAFLSSDRDELVRVLQASFREDKYDDALRSGVAFVERSLRSNLGSSSVRSTAAVAPMHSSSSDGGGSWSSGSSIGSWVILALLFLAGMMVVSFVIRLFRGGMGGGNMAGAGGMGGGYGGGGGGFFSSMLGGIGGAIAGSWLYDRFLGGNAHASDRFDSDSSNAPMSDVGGDWSSSGGDVDSGSSGGDFGGGGDSGGGGGDA